jgi:hypothetical protein
MSEHSDQRRAESLLSSHSSTYFSFFILRIFQISRAKLFRNLIHNQLNSKKTTLLPTGHIYTPAFWKEKLC